MVSNSWSAFSNTEHAPSGQGHSVLFVSRGKGRGHAVPDHYIARELVKLDPTLEVCFASYSTGAEMLRSLGNQVIDLDLPEDNPVWDTVIRVSEAIRKVRPRLLVSHEELCALPLARSFGIPCVYVTDWFGPAESQMTRCVEYAEATVFLDDPGYSDEPPFVKGKIHYVGCVFRPSSPERSSKAECRARLDLPADASIVSVIPGSAAMHSEARSPLLDLIVNSFDLLPCSPRLLVWVASGADYDTVHKVLGDRQDARVLRPFAQVDSLMAASDLAITKGNRMTSLELESLGVPSISISHGANPIDDRRVTRIFSNIPLRARALDAKLLARFMVEGIGRGSRYLRAHAEDVTDHATQAAHCIYTHISRSPVPQAL